MLLSEILLDSSALLIRIISFGSLDIALLTGQKAGGARNWKTFNICLHFEGFAGKSWCEY